MFTGLSNRYDKKIIFKNMLKMSKPLFNLLEFNYSMSNMHSEPFFSLEYMFAGLSQYFL